MQCSLYLIEKRGLYYRPDAAGYTGLKCEAGRYDLDAVAAHFPNFDSPNQDGMTFVDEDDAPEFSSQCAWDVKVKHTAFKDGYDKGVKDTLKQYA
jgi:hypothetical protein